MKFINLFFGLWASIGLSIALAQDNTQPLPKNPVLRRMPAFASWSVTFKYKDEVVAQESGKPRALPDRVLSVTFTKTNKTYWEQTGMRSGKKYEKWIFDGVQLETEPDSPSIIPIPPPTKDMPESEYSDYSHGDFQGLQWVSLDTYKGIASYEGKRAFLFEAEKEGQKVTAILSMDMQLPLYSSVGDVACVYAYNVAPSTPLTPPARFLAVLATHKKGLEALKYHPSRP